MRDVQSKISGIGFSKLGYAAFAAISLMGCNGFNSVQLPVSSGVSNAASAGVATAITVTTAASCSAGGNEYIVFNDANGNGVFDSGETVISDQIVCNGTNGTNGANGSNGLTTLLSMNRVTTGLSACASGAGLEINTGLDANVNGTLDASEISQTQVVCDGVAGADGAAGAVGAAGPAGSNGHSVVFDIVPASTAVCPAGGSTIVMALDINDTGVYSVSDTNQQATTICNGAQATTSPYTVVEPIQPCGNTVANKEVLLRLASGQVLGDVSDTASGANTRLAFVADGSYVDTDASNCAFSLSTSTDGSTRSLSWGGAVQQSWSMMTPASN